MTLTDIILRDMAICRREREKSAAEMTIEEINREIRRRRMRRRLAAFGEVACCVMTVLCVVIALVIGFIACSGYHWE